jgi:hypothetical protein
VFLLAFFFKYVKSRAVFIAALLNQALVIALFLMDKNDVINLPYLWLNFVGCVTVIAIAIVLQVLVGGGGKDKEKQKVLV